MKSRITRLFIFQPVTNSHMKHIPFKAMICLLVLFLMNSATDIHAQSSAERTISTILDQQTAAWNRGDLEAFMSGYWKSDSLMYIGKSGVTYGYDRTLDSYRRNYGDTARMGKLKFDLVQVKRLSPRYYYVVGKWSLKRSAGDVGGHYTLIFKKIKGAWVIVSDHSS
jgi:ketosteroid isomerase-like protein